MAEPTNQQDTRTKPESQTNKIVTNIALNNRVIPGIGQIIVSTLNNVRD